MLFYTTWSIAENRQYIFRGSNSNAFIVYHTWQTSLIISKLSLMERGHLSTLKKLDSDSSMRSITRKGAR